MFSLTKASSITEVLGGQKPKIAVRSVGGLGSGFFGLKVLSGILVGSMTI